ncbi:hypothetical protein QTP88_026021 [Uroleucon formosanum]
MYLNNIKKYREKGRYIYFLDETWVNAGDCTSKTWVDGTIISNRDAFLKGLSTGDYHNEMNGDTFREWMEGILPRLKPYSVIVMDNASYHSVKIDKAPTSNAKNADIINWLQDKGEVADPSMVIPQLLYMVKRLKPLHTKYVIDELLKVNNNTVLRLPSYHCELNPTKLTWSSVKNHVRMNNTIYKLPDVNNLLIEGINRVDTEMWKNFTTPRRRSPNFMKLILL